MISQITPDVNLKYVNIKNVPYFWESERPGAAAIWPGGKKALPRLREPSPGEILEFVSPYLGRDNNKLILLNVAKMVDFARRGADGVVNAICFNCMLGTAAEGLTAQVRKDHRNIPLPTLIYGTTELSAERSKLEAFVYQVHRFAKKKTAVRLPIFS